MERPPGIDRRFSAGIASVMRNAAILVQPLSAAHLREHMERYLAVSVDVSPWTDENFLKDLPEKWELSFALWRDGDPVAYCIMTRRQGLVHINQFMVTARERGRGLGGRMLAEALRRGAASLKVDPSNTGAIQFYERHGFQRHGEENGYVVMRRDAG